MLANKRRRRRAAEREEPVMSVQTAGAPPGEDTATSSIPGWTG